MLLSVVIPVYNERETLFEIIRRVLAVPLELDRELVLVDDRSTDGTRDMYPRLEQEFPDATIRVFKHEVNQGKGAALRTGYREAKGDVVIVQDADLEYNPNDYPKLLGPILDGRADVVYGSRFVGGEEHRVLYFWHTVGNRFLTLLSNMFTDLNLTDMETCYKVFRAEVLKGITLRSNRFGVEPEVTAKVARGKWRIYEVGISYSGRTYEEGKKITWRDGVKAVLAIIRFAFSD
jgi:glycosyltransferase involved in cell wall biosynthesis